VHDSLSCGLVVGKSSVSIAIVFENGFRPYNGRSAVFRSIDLNIRALMLKECVSCVPLLQANEELYGSESWQTITQAERKWLIFVDLGRDFN
jgi:hypothetical protein